MLFLQADVRGQRKEGSIQEIISKISEKIMPLTQNPAQIIIDSERYGREHPFKPLTKKAQNADNFKDASDTKIPANTPSKPQSGIQLTAIFAATDLQNEESTAIIEEDGVGRSISVGDIVAEMTVKEILRGTIILCKNNMEYTVQLGVLPEEIQQMNNEDE